MSKRNSKTKAKPAGVHTHIWTHYVQIIILKLVRTKDKQHFKGSHGENKMAHVEKRQITA